MQSALITGAGTGIGRATAQLLAEAGYRVALCGRNLQRLEDCAASIEGETLCVVADVSVAEQANSAVRTVVEAWGGIDVLINNAGVVGGVAPLPECPEELVHQCIDINLKGAIFMMQAVLNTAMLAQGSGCIINVNSVAGKTAFPNWSLYCASKFGLRAITEASAQELRAQGIQVLGFYPGAVETPIWQQVPSEHTLDSPRLSARTAAEAILHMLRQPKGAVVPELTLTPM